MRGRNVYIYVVWYIEQECIFPQLCATKKVSCFILAHRYKYTRRKFTATSLVYKCNI